MTSDDGNTRVFERNMACVDVLAVACEHDHGELDFDDPRRSIEAVETAALRLLGTDPYWHDTNVAALAMMAANMFRILVGEDDIGRVREVLEKERAYWTHFSGRQNGGV
jgi:hypothetical protein